MRPSNVLRYGMGFSERRPMAEQYADGVLWWRNILKVVLTMALIVVAFGTAAEARCVADSSGVVTCRSSESYLVRRGVGKIKPNEFGRGGTVDRFGRPVLHKPRQLRQPSAKGLAVYSDQNGKRVVCSGKGPALVCH